MRRLRKGRARCAGLRTKTPKAILNGYVVHYNFARSYLSLKGKTPAEQAGIQGLEGPD